MIAISVLIPVYNWRVEDLAASLGREIAGTALEEDVELIVLDDGSSDAEAVAANRRAMAPLSRIGARLIELSANVGRSAARNRLIQEARGRYLLFLDADVVPDSPAFLENYLKYGQKACDVVCGGISYRQCAPQPLRNHDFYLYYSSRASVASAAQRNLHPWKWLFTSNVMVRRDIVAAVPFEEQYQGYGYEDIDWGVRLARHYAVLHIDNTVTHLGLLTKTQLHGKMLQSIDNFMVFARLHPGHASQMKVARLARILSWLPRWSVDTFARTAGTAFMSLRRWNYLSLLFFQAEKALRIASRLQASVSR